LLKSPSLWYFVMEAKLTKTILIHADTQRHMHQTLTMQKWPRLVTDYPVTVMNQSLFQQCSTINQDPGKSRGLEEIPQT